MWIQRLLCIGGMLAGLAANAPGAGVLPDKPLFAVRIEMVGRGGHLLVNDVPVFRNYAALPVTLQVPVNEFMLNGENTFGFELFNTPDEKVPADANASATLILMQNGAPQADAMVVATVALSGHYSRAAAAKYPAIATAAGRAGAAIIAPIDNGLLRVSRSFVSLVRLPDWAWGRGKAIPDDAEMRRGLELAYKSLWSSLAAKDRNALLGAVTEKEAEIAEAYYLTPEAALQTIALPDKPFEKGWTLDAPRWSETILELSGHGRLAHLTYPNATVPIVYHDADHNFHAFDMWWRRDQGRWILTR